MNNYKIDKFHSEVAFKVKHLMITNVSGNFNEFDATLTNENDSLENAKISFQADINSINTNNQQRDEHLKSADFFDAANYPTLRFESSSFNKINGDNYELIGDLSIKNITKKVHLTVEFTGSVVDPYGQSKLGFEVNGIINRKDFGLTWSAVTEAGGLVVGEEIKLHFNVQMIKQ